MTSPLYLAAAVRTGLGPHLRPGGDRLTRRILELTVPGPATKMADIGCGTGAGLALFRHRNLSHLIGIDLDEGLLRTTASRGFAAACADMAALPLAGGCLDLLVCDCAWNLSDKQRSLAEFFRVLRPGGLLALADMYLRNPTVGLWPIASCLRAATGMVEVNDQISAAGFRTLHLEDHSRLLTEAAALFVLAHGSQAGFWHAVTGCQETAGQLCQAAATTRPGLFLLIGERAHG